MRRFLKWTGLSLLGVLLLVATIALTIWSKPGLILNTKNLDRAIPYLDRRGIPLALKQGVLEARSEGFLKKSIQLRFQELCWDGLIGPLKRPCISDVDIDTALEFGRADGRFIQIRKAHLKLAALDIPPSGPHADDEKKSDDETEASWLEQFGWLRRIDWHDIRIDVDTLRLVGGKDQPSMEFRGHVASDGPERLRANVKILRSSKRASERLESEVKFELVRRERDLDIDIAGFVEGREPLPYRVEVGTCHIDAVFAEHAPNAPLPFETVKMECRAGLVPKPRFEKWGHIKRWSLGKLPLILNASLRSDKDGALFARGRVEVGPIAAKNAIHARIGIEAEEFDLRELEKGGRPPDLKIDAELGTKNLQSVGPFLKIFDWAIPSPFHVLKGPVQVSAKGHLRVPELAGQLDLTLMTRLKSPSQVLNLDAEGTAKFRDCHPPESRALLEVELISKQARLQLPGIDYADPPPLVPDSRFKKGDGPVAKAPKKPEAGCGIDTSFRFRTAKDSKFMIEGPILKNALPVEIDIGTSTTKPLFGWVAINNFKTELFRREATLQHLNLDLDTMILAATATVATTDYLVRIQANGPVSSLKISMESDPPLPNLSILSVLLFGRPLDALDDDQSSSVANTEAAAANGALGLASLYLFASTPIETVGYDPKSQTVTAKIRLRDGTSLAVAANDGGVTDVGLRQKLSSQWRIETTIRNPNDPAVRSTLTVLEWFKRF